MAKIFRRCEPEISSHRHRPTKYRTLPKQPESKRESESINPKNGKNGYGENGMKFSGRLNDITFSDTKIKKEKKITPEEALLERRIERLHRQAEQSLFYE